MKKLPIGIQSIEKILKSNAYAYVDKTGFIKQLIDEGFPHYFISRPRRFGKSLFVNTLKQVFSGNKKLFKGLDIHESDYNWKKYPVVALDFSKIANSTPDELKAALKIRLEIIANEHNISIIAADIQVALDTLVVQLSKKYKSKVVVLIDEYDKPIIDHLDDPIVAEQNKDVLKGFFGTLKGLDGELKLTFITGISKFSQVSLFSGLNNLKNITMDPKYAGIMGYTEKELRENFQDHIKQIAKERGKQVTEKSIIDEIRMWYNGYRFSENPLTVYNPYSTLHYFSDKKAESYWYSTGTPSFLIDEVKNRPQSLTSLSGISALKSTLSDISSVDRIHLGALMFQTGYLTIRGYNPDENSFLLDFPNKEVKEAFFNSLLQDFAEVDPLEVTRSAKGIKEDLQSLRFDAFMEKMNVHFAKMPYHVFQRAKEGFYQAVFFTFLEISGIKTLAEVATNIGRIDLMTETSERICIFELKLDQSASIGLSQAERNRYRERFTHSGKETLVIGVNFSSTSRSISDWKGALYDPSGNPVREILPSVAVAP
ncbi:MAG: AAA family ATPase [Chlamydiia bacterium]|nr:AAA family ATPase [Chlamydiia bacterium]